MISQSLVLPPYSGEGVRPPADSAFWWEAYNGGGLELSYGITILIARPQTQDMLLVYLVAVSVRPTETFL